MIKDEIKAGLEKTLKELGVWEEGMEIQISITSNPQFGDYSSNIALIAFGKSKIKNQKSKIQVKNKKFGTPLNLAEEIAEILNSKFIIHNSAIDKVEAIAPGFINFFLSQDYLVSQLSAEQNSKKQTKESVKRIIVEYAHPNTHKEMHIGHMRTLITGEALSRFLESQGNRVFRANYQGDIGPHVAKAIYGIQKIMADEGLTLEKVDKWSSKEKAHFLGKGYVRGNQDYDNRKEEIDELNKKLYVKSEDVWDIYTKTRQWSLDYYDEFYTRYYTKFDKLFFESEVADFAKKIVEENTGKIFEKDEGAIVFRGEEYGLHTRVFITKQGNPTYEGKDMGLGFIQYEAFPFDRNIHVVANEQAGYFQVVIKALELIDPEKFKNKEFHLSMGMVHLTDPSAGSGQAKKMSSRTGEVLTVDWLIDKVKERVFSLIEEGRISENREQVLEEIAIGAIKFSVLKVGTGQDVSFDIEKSVSLEGESGPYLQYAYARTRSILAKSQIINHKFQINTKYKIQNTRYEVEELSLLRSISHFNEVVEDSANHLSPNILCSYLFDLAQKFNLFYQKHRVVGSKNEEFRMALVASVGKTIKTGLDLLGIKAPEKM